MVGKATATLALALLLLAASADIQAQKMGECNLDLLPDGSPRFTQVLRWQADPAVLYYEVSVEPVSGGETSVWRLEEPLLELNLQPGEYRYRLVLFNMLGKPELTLPWRNITVLKAEKPRVTSLSKTTWYLEDLQPELLLSGENIVDGATIELRPSTPSQSHLPGRQQAKEGSAGLRIVFPSSGLAAGRYSLVLTNPGGLSVTLPEAVDVRYLRPLDLLVTIGYEPWIPLVFDAWYGEAWQDSVFPIGTTSRLTACFIKKPFGYFGVEVAVHGRLMSGGIDNAAIDTQIGMTGLGVFYRFLFNKAFSVAGRTGGGLVMSHHAFDYGGKPGAELYSLDPYVTAGLFLQCFVTKHFFVETGADWMQGFTRDSTHGGLLPSLSAGLLL